MATETVAVTESTPPARRARAGAGLLTWLGVVPFFLFALAFLVAPASYLFIGSFQTLDGQFTLDNFRNLNQPIVVEAYKNSLQVSFATALGGTIFGFLLAYAVTLGRAGRVRSGLLTFSGVASNFAGVPLAFAFIATLGRIGLITTMLKAVGIDLYQQGFSLYSFAGLSLTYMYFQFPLMILIITPALEGLKREWREAAENLGASSGQYWRYIAFPVLLPSLLGTLILLFANAFGAFATAFALTGGTINLVTILIGSQMRGDVLRDPGLGYALAVGMVAIMAVSITAYTLLQRRSERWLKR
ncbi:MAG: ABC transporter permease subunit [Candidatus Promineofilum sp.]|nr:ABC transporter permease subunit [Promineifilum sp.]